MAGIPVRLYGPVKLGPRGTPKRSTASKRGGCVEDVGDTMTSYWRMASANSPLMTPRTRCACT